MHVEKWNVVVFPLGLSHFSRTLYSDLIISDYVLWITAWHFVIMPSILWDVSVHHQSSMIGKMIGKQE